MHTIMLTKNERTCRGKIENETQTNKRQTKTDDISQASTNQLQYDQNITKITKHNINIDVISIIAIITIIAINNPNMNVIISNMACRDGYSQQPLSQAILLPVA